MVPKRGGKKRRPPSPAAGEKAPKKLRAEGPGPLVTNDGTAVVSRGINFKDLDLDTSYVGKLPNPVQPARPDRQQWEYIEGEIAAGKVPAGWNYEEPNIDQNDIDAQIKRCYERIEENIMPHIFKDKLEEYKKRRVKQQELIEKNPGLDWMVIQRIEILKEIDRWLEEGGDKSKLRGNVKAVIDAYKAKKLKWTPGLVTYWAKGVQVSEPRPWDIEASATIAMHIGGNEDFWVEECQAKSEQELLGYMWHGPQHFMNPSTHHVQHNLQIRIFDNDNTEEPGRMADLNVIDDSGSDVMCLYESDYDGLLRLCNTVGLDCGAPVSGVAYVKQFDGNRALCHTRTLWVNIHIPGAGPGTKEPLGAWTLVRYVLWSHSRHAVHAPPRINGPWLRSILFSASYSNGDGNLGSNISFFRAKSWFNVVSVTRWSRIRGEKKKHKLLQLAATRKNEQTEQSVYCGGMKERRREQEEEALLYLQNWGHPVSRL